MPVTHPGRGRLRRAAASVRSHVRQSRHVDEDHLPLADLLPPDRVRQAIATHGPRVRSCGWSPLVTLYAFLGQVLDADPSCRQARARRLALQVARGGDGGAGGGDASVDTGAYCKARCRLGERLPAALARDVGHDLHARHGRGGTPGLLRGRPIKVVDGTTCSMPDTPANQAAYPQAKTQKAGLGFPVLRLVAVLCLACGAALDAAIGPYAGKATGETALLRGLVDGGTFAAGDVVLGDRYFCSYWQLAQLRARGADALFRLHQPRRADFLAGRRLGPDDHVVTWQRPQRPDWMDAAAYAAVPATMEVREMRHRAAIKGFRVTEVVLATTPLDAALYPAAELAAAYRARWHAELDLRSIKVALGMDVLRCKTPAVVRAEVWMHLLAYNLVRTAMAEAATGAAPAGVAAAKSPPPVVPPARAISFTAGLQLVRAFAPLAAVASTPDAAGRMRAALLAALAGEVVGDRPDRVEPRAVKRRPKPTRLLTEPRDAARERLLKTGGSAAKAERC